MRLRTVFALLASALLLLASTAATAGDLAAELRELETDVIPAGERDAAQQQLGADLSAELKAVNQANSAAWSQIDSLSAWQAFRQERLAALRQSLRWPAKRPRPAVHVTGEHAGEGYRVQNILYETRPRFFVSANLYLPAKPADSMPGLLLSHSHHSPKTQGELQDMGMTWARAGCAVLVPDHLGHGERREHPFVSAKDFDQEFAVGRQDYYFRYDLGMQLHLAGESLMGWLVWDLSAGVDVLLMQPGIDPQRIILLGGVAGGGDPAAVAGALDERITCVGPFNFGGPQPETRYPLPDDAETWFNYAGSGSWESTRNLTGSAAGLGFQPWVIVGSIAPRKVIYGHEFSWDAERDPVWKRFEKIWSWHDARDGLAVAHGKGNLRGQEPESSHCGNIGAFHRRMIHPLLDKWFNIHSSAEKEFSARRGASELTCWTDEAKAKLRPRFARELLRDRVIADRDPVEPLFAEFPAQKKAPQPELVSEQTSAVFQAARIRLGERSALLLLTPAGGGGKRHPVVFGFCQRGKAAFLSAQASEIARLLEARVAVCLVDVRGTGEFNPGDDAGPYSARTAHSSTALMLGRPLAATQHADLSAAIDYVRARPDIQGDRWTVWAESFAPALASDAPFNYPRRIDRPGESEPLAALLALALAREKPLGIYAHGGLGSLASTLDSPFVQMPHDAVIPGVLLGGDLPQRVAALAPLPVRLEGLVDGRNRLCTAETLERDYAAAREAYAKRQASDSLVVQTDRSSPAEFLLSVLQGGR